METVDIPIAKELSEKIEKRLSSTKFKTVSEYVSFVLSETMKNLEKEEDISSEEEEKATEILKNIGYLK